MRANRVAERAEASAQFEAFLCFSLIRQFQALAERFDTEADDDNDGRIILEETSCQASCLIR